MVSSEIVRKFVNQIKEKHSQINEPTLEKDFYLTLLLNEISKDIEENQESVFCKLVFKGGTLLSRAHLFRLYYSPVYGTEEFVKNRRPKGRGVFLSMLRNRWLTLH